MDAHVLDLSVGGVRFWVPGASRMLSGLRPGRYRAQLELPHARLDVWLRPIWREGACYGARLIHLTAAAAFALSAALEEEKA